MDPFQNRNENRPRAAWRLMIHWVSYVTLASPIALLIAAVLDPWVSGFATGGGATPSSASPIPPGVRLASSLGSTAAALISAWIVGRFADRRPFSDFGFHLSRMWFADLGFGMFLGATLMTCVFVVEWAMGWVRVTGTLETYTDGPFVLALMLPLSIFLSAAVGEEILYRAYRIKNLAEGLNLPRIGPRGAVVSALVLTSAYFGLRHADNPNATSTSTLIITAAGLMLGFAYVRTGELALPLGLHFTWNLFQGNVFGFPVSGFAPAGATFVEVDQLGPPLLTGGVFGPEGGIVGLCAMLAGFLLITLWTYATRSELARATAELSTYKR